MKKDWDSVLMLEATTRAVKTSMSRAFDKIGMEVTLDQWQLMGLIAEHESCSQRKLADLSGKDPASITRMIDTLEKGQWVDRKTIEGNRRQFGLVLTRKGKGLLKSYHGFVKELAERAFLDFSKGERESLHAMLMRVQGNVADGMD